MSKKVLADLKIGEFAIWNHPRGSPTNGQVYVAMSSDKYFTSRKYKYGITVNAANHWPASYWIKIIPTKLEKLVYGLD